jgi:hypothetical protein
MNDDGRRLWCRDVTREGRGIHDPRGRGKSFPPTFTMAAKDPYAFITDLLAGGTAGA